MKSNSEYTNEIINPEAAPRGWTEIEGQSIEVLFRMPYPAQYNPATQELRVRIPVGSIPAPMFTEALIGHCQHELGKRDAAIVLDNLADEYYRQIVLKQMLA